MKQHPLIPTSIWTSPRSNREWVFTRRRNGWPPLRISWRNTNTRLRNELVAVPQHKAVPVITGLLAELNRLRDEARSQKSVGVAA